MTVRRATSADVPSLLQLYRDLVGQAPLADAAAVEAVLAHPGTSIWCAEARGAVCAMATLHVLPNVTQSGRPYAVIENVVTSAAQRGLGHGRTVMQAAISEAWAMDAYKIMLMTGKTAQARGFYEALGFSAEEKWAMTLRRAPLRQP